MYESFSFFFPEIVKIKFKNNNSFPSIVFMFITFITLFCTGVTHSEELSYLFYPHMMKDLGLPPFAPNSKDYKIMNRLTQMWTDFAKTGYLIFLYNFLQSRVY